MTNQSQPKNNWSLLAFALVPFAASCCFYSAPTAAAVTGKRAIAPLVFDRYLVDYGPMPVQAMVNPDKPDEPPTITVPYYYRNTSTQPIEIKSLTPSCGCLQPRVGSMTVEPGGYGRLIMPVAIANEPAGPKEYLVKVIYQDEKIHEVDLALKMVLPEKQIEVTPRALWFYQSGTKPTTEYVTITDLRADSLEIESVECSSDFWTVEKKVDITNEFGHRIVKLAVTLKSDIPPGKHRGIINVLTNDPRNRRIQIAIGGQSMQADVPVVLKAEPGQLRLMPTPTGEFEAITTVSNPDGTPAEVEIVASSSPDIVQATLETDENNQSILRVSAPATPIDHRAVLTVRKVESEETITIPVLVPKSK